MKLRLILAAFMLGVAGIAAPAAAQTVPAAGQTLSPEMQAFADALATSIGKSDKILLYAEVGPSLSVKGATRFMLRFQPPDARVVRVFNGNPEAIVRAFVGVVVSERQAGKTWEQMIVLIDHGKVSVTFTEPAELAPGDFDSRLAAATGRIFPGLTVEPFKRD